MFGSLPKILLKSLLLSLFCICGAWAFTPDPAQKSEEKTPYEVGSSGGFDYEIPLGIPAYRGLAPDLKLRYRSSNLSRGSTDDILGIGWSLSGLSRIERVSQGRGTPFFVDGEDIFQLDGKALMACADGAATNKWSGAYPARFKTDKASSSCRAGGNFSTIIESDLKIVRNAPANEWTVFGRNGTRYIYRSAKTLSGINPAAGGDADKLLNKTTWLLAEIRNTQATASVVRISYSFASGSGYASRPSRISYGGYTVDFGYETRPVAQSQWATGTSLLGEQRFRLVSVWSSRGSEKIAAYRLQYGASAQTKSSLLTRVEQFGSNFTMSSNRITGGSVMPNPYVLSYSADQVSFAKKTYSNKPVSGNVTVWDYDRDGTDEVFSRGFTTATQICDRGYSVGTHSVATGIYRFGPSKNLSSLSVPSYLSDAMLPIFNERNLGQGYRSVTAIDGITRFDPSMGAAGQRAVLIRRYEHFQEGSEGEEGVKQFLQNYAVSPGSSKLDEVEIGRGEFTQTNDKIKPIVGNFDLDPASEVLTNTRAYDITSGQFIYRGKFKYARGLKMDMDGDSINELLYTGEANSLQPLNWELNEPRQQATPYFDRRYIPNAGLNVAGGPAHLNQSYNRLRAIHATGDINGDGKDDVVILKLHQSYQDEVHAAISTGTKFVNQKVWATSAQTPDSTFRENSNEEPTPQLVIRDVNGDGLGDLLIHEGSRFYRASCSRSNPDRSVAFLRGHVRVLISDGTKFLTPSRSDARRIAAYAGVGDFNGDGLYDLLSEGDNGVIHYGSGGIPNLLTSITDPLGGTTKVTYAPSTVAGASNKVPGVQQLVAQVRRENGRGATRTLKYRYNGSEYDYFLRRSLGFQTVTTTLPRIGGETADPQIVRNYLNNSYGEHGVLKSKTLMRSGQTWQKEINDHSKVLTGKGPYSVRRTKERVAVRHSSKLLETTKTFGFSEFGVLTRITDYGRTVNGNNLTKVDDVTSGWTYVPNRSAYIVNKPQHSWRQTKTSNTYDRAALLNFSWYYYDGKAHNVAPAHGNLTGIREWTGNRNAWSSRVVSNMIYDSRGNLLTERDGLSKGSTHTYGGPDGLFRITTTNAAGDKTSFAYNYVCGDVSAETDPNGLKTTQTYDAFCRDLRTTYPDGNLRAMYYYNLGKGGSQSTLERRRSAGKVSNNVYKDTRTYFDGFGEVYKSTKTGRTHRVADSIATVATYDARGNKTSESIPLSWAGAADNAASNSEKTRFEYDTLGRRTKVIHPNGAAVTTTHSTYPRSFANRPMMDVQDIVTRDERCGFASSSVVCGLTVDSYDTSGNKVLSFAYDEKGSDVDGSAKQWRTTRYEYDLNNNLTKVVDPSGNTWSYSYDIYGNRTVANDPSLGRWTMKYNAVNSLIEQTDSKGQKIRFAHDALQRLTRKDVVRSNATLESRIDYRYGEARSGRYNKGRLTTVSKAGHIVTYDYWKTGQVWIETHKIGGRTYPIQNAIRFGQVNNQKLPYKAGSTATRWEGEQTFDAANRMISFAGRINSVSYDLRSQPTQYAYANGVTDTRTYDARRGWLNSSYVRRGDSNVSWTTYSRHPDGRIKYERTSEQQGAYNYTYDYKGQLLKADNPYSAHAAMDQTFVYDRAGRMRKNSHVGTYDYNTAIPRHAPYRIRGTSATTALSFDANGNMTRGFEGRVMTYDAENRPLSVQKSGTTTRYEYGALGKRLKKIETQPGQATKTTVYFGPVEIRNYGKGAAEEVVTYPHPNVRIVNGVPAYLHKDQLETVRAVTNNSGLREKRATYKPFGEKRDYIDRVSPTETKGFVGERFDELAELQFLNARYYDPELGIFIQPDWYDVTNPRVGTNRYAYSLNDPVNLADPNGNFVPLAVWGAIAAYKAVSVAITVVDAVDTIEAVTSGEMTAGQAVGQVAKDALIGATVGKGVAKAGGAIVSRVQRRANVTKPETPGQKPGGCPNNSSFHPLTPVLTQFGTQPIGQINVGDIVLAADPATGTLTYERVTATHNSDYDETYIITVLDDEGTHQEIRSSYNHPFFVTFEPEEPRFLTVSSHGLEYKGEIEGGAWVDAIELRPGNKVREPDGTMLEIVSVDILDAPLTAYNLTVENAHTYFVGGEDFAVWVHNCPNKPQGSPQITPNDLKSKTRTEIRELADQKGLIPAGDRTSADYPRKWKDPVTSKQRVRLDRGHIDPKTGKPYDNPKAAKDHVHGYEADGNTKVEVDGDPHIPTEGE